MTLILTAKLKAELKKEAKEIGISYEALLEMEEMSALVKEGGFEALEAAGYRVTGV